MKDFLAMNVEGDKLLQLLQNFRANWVLLLCNTCMTLQNRTVYFPFRKNLRGNLFLLYYLNSLGDFFLSLSFKGSYNAFLLV